MNNKDEMSQKNLDSLSPQEINKTHVDSETSDNGLLTCEDPNESSLLNSIVEAVMRGDMNEVVSLALSHRNTDSKNRGFVDQALSTALRNKLRCDQIKESENENNCEGRREIYEKDDVSESKTNSTVDRPVDVSTVYSSMSKSDEDNELQCSYYIDSSSIVESGKNDTFSQSGYNQSIEIENHSGDQVDGNFSQYQTSNSTYQHLENLNSSKQSQQSVQVQLPGIGNFLLQIPSNLKPGEPITLPISLPLTPASQTSGGNQISINMNTGQIISNQLLSLYNPSCINNIAIGKKMRAIAPKPSKPTYRQPLIAPKTNSPNSSFNQDCINMGNLTPLPAPSGPGRRKGTKGKKVGRKRGPQPKSRKDSSYASSTHSIDSQDTIQFSESSNTMKQNCNNFINSRNTYQCNYYVNSDSSEYINQSHIVPHSYNELQSNNIIDTSDSGEKDLLSLAWEISNADLGNNDDFSTTYQLYDANNMGSETFVSSEILDQFLQNIQKDDMSDLSRCSSAQINLDSRVSYASSFTPLPPCSTVLPSVTTSNYLNNSSNNQTNLGLSHCIEIAEVVNLNTEDMLSELEKDENALLDKFVAQYSSNTQCPLDNQHAAILKYRNHDREVNLLENKTDYSEKDLDPSTKESNELSEIAKQIEKDCDVSSMNNSSMCRNYLSQHDYNYQKEVNPLNVSNVNSIIHNHDTYLPSDSGGFCRQVTTALDIIYSTTSDSFNSPVAIDDTNHYTMSVNMDTKLQSEATYFITNSSLKSKTLDDFGLLEFCTESGEGQYNDCLDDKRYLQPPILEDISDASPIPSDDESVDEDIDLCAFKLSTCNHLTLFSNRMYQNKCGNINNFWNTSKMDDLLTLLDTSQLECQRFSSDQWYAYDNFITTSDAFSCLKILEIRKDSDLPFSISVDKNSDPQKQITNKEIVKNGKAGRRKKIIDKDDLIDIKNRRKNGFNSDLPKLRRFNRNDKMSINVRTKNDGSNTIFSNDKIVKRNIRMSVNVDNKKEDNFKRKVKNSKDNVYENHPVIKLGKNKKVKNVSKIDFDAPKKLDTVLENVEECDVKEIDFTSKLRKTKEVKASINSSFLEESESGKYSDELNSKHDTEVVNNTSSEHGKLKENSNLSHNDESVTRKDSENMSNETHSSETNSNIVESVNSTLDLRLNYSQNEETEYGIDSTHSSIKNSDKNIPEKIGAKPRGRTKSQKNKYLTDKKKIQENDGLKDQRFHIETCHTFEINESRNVEVLKDNSLHNEQCDEKYDNSEDMISQTRSHTCNESNYSTIDKVSCEIIEEIKDFAIDNDKNLISDEKKVEKENIENKIINYEPSNIIRHIEHDDISNDSNKADISNKDTNKSEQVMIQRNLDINLIDKAQGEECNDFQNQKDTVIQTDTNESITATNVNDESGMKIDRADLSTEVKKKRINFNDGLTKDKRINKNVMKSVSLPYCKDKGKYLTDLNDAGVNIDSTKHRRVKQYKNNLHEDLNSSNYTDRKSRLRKPPLKLALYHSIKFIENDFIDKNAGDIQSLKDIEVNKTKKEVDKSGLSVQNSRINHCTRSKVLISKSYDSFYETLEKSKRNQNPKRKSENQCIIRKNKFNTNRVKKTAEKENSVIKSILDLNQSNSDIIESRPDTLFLSNDFEAKDNLNTNLLPEINTVLRAKKAKKIQNVSKKYNLRKNSVDNHKISKVVHESKSKNLKNDFTIVKSKKYKKKVLFDDKSRLNEKDHEFKETEKINFAKLFEDDQFDILTENEFMTEICIESILRCGELYTASVSIGQAIKSNIVEVLQNVFITECNKSDDIFKKSFPVRKINRKLRLLSGLEYERRVNYSTILDSPNFEDVLEYTIHFQLLEFTTVLNILISGLDCKYSVSKEMESKLEYQLFEVNDEDFDDADSCDARLVIVENEDILTEPFVDTSETKDVRLISTDKHIIEVDNSWNSQMETLNCSSSNNAGDDVTSLELTDKNNVQNVSGNSNIINVELLNNTLKCNVQNEGMSEVNDSIATIKEAIYAVENIQNRLYNSITIDIERLDYYSCDTIQNVENSLTADLELFDKGETNNISSMNPDVQISDDTRAVNKEKALNIGKDSTILKEEDVSMRYSLRNKSKESSNSVVVDPIDVSINLRRKSLRRTCKKLENLNNEYISETLSNEENDLTDKANDKSVTKNDCVILPNENDSYETASNIVESIKSDLDKDFFITNKSQSCENNVIDQSNLSLISNDSPHEIQFKNFENDLELETVSQKVISHTKGEITSKILKRIKGSRLKLKIYQNLVRFIWRAKGIKNINYRLRLKKKLFKKPSDIENIALIENGVAKINIEPEDLSKHNDDNEIECIQVSDDIPDNKLYTTVDSNNFETYSRSYGSFSLKIKFQKQDPLELQESKNDHRKRKKGSRKRKRLRNFLNSIIGSNDNECSKYNSGYESLDEESNCDSKCSSTRKRKHSSTTICSIDSSNQENINQNDHPPKLTPESIVNDDEDCEHQKPIKIKLFKSTNDDRSKSEEIIFSLQKSNSKDVKEKSSAPKMLQVLKDQQFKPCRQAANLAKKKIFSTAKEDRRSQNATLTSIWNSRKVNNVTNKLPNDFINRCNDRRRKPRGRPPKSAHLSLFSEKYNSNPGSLKLKIRLSKDFKNCNDDNLSSNGENSGRTSTNDSSILNSAVAGINGPPDGLSLESNNFINGLTEQLEDNIDYLEVKEAKVYFDPNQVDIEKIKNSYYSSKKNNSMNFDGSSQQNLYDSPSGGCDDKKNTLSETNQEYSNYNANDSGTSYNNLSSSYNCNNKISHLPKDLINISENCYSTLSTNREPQDLSQSNQPYSFNNQIPSPEKNQFELWQSSKPNSAEFLSTCINGNNSWLQKHRPFPNSNSILYDSYLTPNNKDTKSCVSQNQNPSFMVCENETSDSKQTEINLAKQNLGKEGRKSSNNLFESKSQLSPNQSRGVIGSVPSQLNIQNWSDETNHNASLNHTAAAWMTYAQQQAAAAAYIDPQMKAYYNLALSQSMLNNPYCGAYGNPAGNPENFYTSLHSQYLNNSKELMEKNHSTGSIRNHNDTMGTFMEAAQISSWEHFYSAAAMAGYHNTSQGAMDEYAGRAGSMLQAHHMLAGGYPSSVLSRDHFPIDGNKPPVAHQNQSGTTSPMKPISSPTPISSAQAYPHVQMPYSHFNGFF